jgi:hypothetical protein
MGKGLENFLMRRWSLSTFGRKKEPNMIWLRASYWIGAITGFLVALPIVLSVHPAFVPGRALFPWADANFLLRMGGSFILGWSFLLIWADQRPYDRKGVLLLTLCPVLTAWAAAEIFAVLIAGLSFLARLPFWVLLGSLSFLFVFSYFQARRPYHKWWTQRV